MDNVVFAYVFGTVGDKGSGGDGWVGEEDRRGLALC